MDLCDKLAEAWRRRDRLHEDGETDAYRLFHGYGEGEPGLNVDRFGSTIVLWLRQHHGLDLAAVCAFYEQGLKLDLILAKEGSRDCGRVLSGQAVSTAVTIQEHGLRYAVDLMAAQNAGIFLDARPARRWLRDHSEGLRVANLFAYTGSLGVAALAGGARSVEQVDLQAGQLRRARLNHELNQQRVSDRDFQVIEAGRWLRQAARKERIFDGVILDPPPRTPHGRARFRRDRLYALAAEVIGPAGWVLVFFNRRGLLVEDEEQEVVAATQGALQPFWRGSSGPDFYEPDPSNRLHFSAFRGR